jgi:ribosome-binding ATPase YchF (GTP1/OBG family)
MRIAHTGFQIADGKFKYVEPPFTALVEKFQPVKLSPYYFEFKADDYENGQAIAITADRALDLLILDIEKIEGRLARTTDAAEQAVLAKCQAQLESQQPVCDLALSEDERAAVRAFGLFTFKPTLILPDAAADAQAVCQALMGKVPWMFFYTVGKPEVHAWLVERNADAVTCAGRIHTDLARGFIKAEIFSYEDILATHNVQDARSKGLVKLVGRDFPVPENSIIEIRFNV